MKKINLRRIQSLIKNWRVVAGTLLLTRNWCTLLLGYFGLWNRPFITYRLRGGVCYRAMSGYPARRMIIETWVRKVYTREFGIAEDDIVVDIGANIGVFSIYASRLAKNGSVYAFEPWPASFALLRENVKLNGAKNIMLIDKAVCGHSGTGTLFLDEANIGGASLFRFGQSQIKVETISLEDFFKGTGISRIDFMKMDCEGAEYEILSSCDQQFLSRVEKIAMESHELDKERNTDYLKDFLEVAGFKVKVLPAVPSKTAYIYAIRQGFHDQTQGS
ncbi:MAG: FkbM family methyltransferase [bacterium]